MEHGIISLCPKMQEGVILSKMMQGKVKLQKAARLQRINTCGKTHETEITLELVQLVRISWWY